MLLKPHPRAHVDGSVQRVKYAALQTAPPATGASEKKLLLGQKFYFASFSDGEKALKRLLTRFLLSVEAETLKVMVKAQLLVH